MQAIADGLIQDPSVSAAEAQNYIKSQNKTAADRAAGIAEKRSQFQQLSPVTQRQIAGFGFVNDLVQGIDEELSKPENQKYLQDQTFGSQLAENLQRRVVVGLYNAGLASSPDDDLRTAITSFMQIAGASPWMSNTRSFLWISQIQQHLPGPKDTWALVRAKLDNMKHQLKLIERETYDAASMTRGDVRKRLQGMGGAGAEVPGTGTGAGAPESGTPGTHDLGDGFSVTIH